MQSKLNIVWLGRNIRRNIVFLMLYADLSSIEINQVLFDVVYEKFYCILFPNEFAYPKNALEREDGEQLSRDNKCLAFSFFDVTDLPTLVHYGFFASRCTRGIRIYPPVPFRPYLISNVPKGLNCAHVYEKEETERKKQLRMRFRWGWREGRSSFVISLEIVASISIFLTRHISKSLRGE